MHTKYRDRELFTGIWMPSIVFEVLEEGVISHSEAILLLTVEANTSTKEGCSATNAELGEMIHRSPMHVSSMISKLRERGLLKDISLGTGDRELVTCWGRPFSDEARF